jgi:hypothetical protein
MYAGNATGQSIQMNNIAGIAVAPSSGLLFRRRTALNDALSEVKVWIF